MQVASMGAEAAVQAGFKRHDNRKALRNMSGLLLSTEIMYYYLKWMCQTLLDGES